MIIVIQCAARKQEPAGQLINSDGNRVMFVAHPELAPRHNETIYAHPDDVDVDGVSWREKLAKINERPETDTLNLLPSWRLYKNPAYANLVHKFGANKIYILSAGWGLVPAEYLLPNYDITFSASSPKFKRRRKLDQYADYKGIPCSNSEPIVYLGGKDYVPLFVELTSKVAGRRLVIYNSMNRPRVVSCETKRYNTNTRTNWHYQCAADIISGEFLSDLRPTGNFTAQADYE